MNHILKVNHINKATKKAEILNDVSFKIPKGSIFAFLGPNGAGKSTLINILAKLAKPSSGEFIMEDQNIGIVFQNNTLDEELTIYENLTIRGSLYKIEKKKLQNNIKKIITLFNMENFVNKKYKECSGGQQRIAMIARAVIIEPGILILDEPTTALDPKIRRTVWNVLLKLNKEKHMTLFFSSHYLEEAYYANYICILNKGQVLFEGETEKLLNQNGLKKLIIKGKKHSDEMLVNSIKDGLRYINRSNISDIISVSLGDVSLEEMFLKMTEDGS